MACKEGGMHLRNEQIWKQKTPCLNVLSSREVALFRALPRAFEQRYLCYRLFWALMLSNSAQSSHSWSLGWVFPAFFFPYPLHSCFFLCSLFFFSFPEMRHHPPKNEMEMLALFMLLLPVSLALSFSKGFPLSATHVFFWCFNSGSLVVRYLSSHPPFYSSSYLTSFFPLYIRLHVLALSSYCSPLPFHLGTKRLFCGLMSPSCRPASSTMTGRNLHLATSMGLFLFIFHSTLPF